MSWLTTTYFLFIIKVIFYISLLYDVLFTFCTKGEFYFLLRCWIKPLIWLGSLSLSSIVCILSLLSIKSIPIIFILIWIKCCHWSFIEKLGFNSDVYKFLLNLVLYFLVAFLIYNWSQTVQYNLYISILMSVDLVIKSTLLDLRERNANHSIPSYFHLPFSCRSLVDRRDFLQIYVLMIVINMGILAI